MLFFDFCCNFENSALQSVESCLFCFPGSAQRLQHQPFPSFLSLYHQSFTLTITLLLYFSHKSFSSSQSPYPSCLSHSLQPLYLFFEWRFFFPTFLFLSDPQGRLNKLEYHLKEHHFDSKTHKLVHLRHLSPLILNILAYK